MSRFSDRLKDVLSDKRIGSSEIVGRLNDLFETVQQDNRLLEKSIVRVKKELEHFTVVGNYVDNLKSVLRLNDKCKLRKFFEDYSEAECIKYNAIFSKLYKKLPNAKKIITLSRSGTLLNVLRLWHSKNKRLRIIICESRPMFEGRLLAEDLLRLGFQVELITDSAIGLYVREIDAAVIGADMVLKNGSIVNKTGSKALAVLCREYEKPFFVVTTRSKISNKKNFRPIKEKSDAVWNKQHKNLKVKNIYFEKVESKFITKIISE